MFKNVIHNAASRAQFISKKDIQNGELPRLPFNGIWIHTTSVKAAIKEGGWKPHLNKNTIYGTAVYLARIKWNLDEDLDASILQSLTCELPDPFDYFGQNDTILCQLAINANEIMCEFHSTRFGIGNTQTHLLAYLKEQGVRHAGRSPSRGDSHSNLAIAAHFRGKNIRAAHFIEENVEVIAVYDPSCIRIIDEKTDC